MKNCSKQVLMSFDGREKAANVGTPGSIKTYFLKDLRNVYAYLYKITFLLRRLNVQGTYEV